ncbi:hypothetical protein [Pandoraea bronchicola]|uniref:Secreted protein n=1 Tax=Pandoraea bronchicola TaxID=2508287 RepID=A0A5E5BW60_9BURK|nr:hypothetical protein [Pandoraea bronchicola]VVE89854.1 hypothetical protein PBR20603_03827 [Pandoraea bronchicola]
MPLFSIKTIACSATLSFSLVLSAYQEVRAEAPTVLYPIKTLRGSVHVESGTAANITCRLDPNGCGETATGGMQILATPPAGHSLCYAIVRDVNWSGGGASTGYNLAGQPNVGSFATYRLTVGAAADSTPFGGGNTANLNFIIVAVRNDYADFANSHVVNAFPAVLTADNDPSRIVCPQNIAHDGNGNVAMHFSKTEDWSNQWHDEIIPLDLSMPGGCIAGGFSPDPNDRCYKKH